MKREEVQQVLTILRINYPQSFSKFTYDESEMFLSLWAEAFKDDDTELVVAAVKAIVYSDTRNFSPNIAQVKEKMFELMTAKDTVTEQEAWSIVYKAICNSGYDSEIEFKKLPKDIQSVVGSPSMLQSWAMMNVDEVQSVIASNFMRSYKARMIAIKKEKLLPNEIKQQIDHKKKIEIENSVNKLVLKAKDF